MAIRRACSYSVAITTPKPTSTYSKMLFTIQQEQQNVISKDETELVVDDESVTIHLSQEETLLLETGACYLQLRCYASTYDAPGSACFKVVVLPSLDDTILGGT